jgi:hypothetical protein
MPSSFEVIKIFRELLKSTKQQQCGHNFLINLIDFSPFKLFPTYMVAPQNGFIALICT